MDRVTGRAHARAGLLGNPSDAFDGKAIGIVVRNFSASVTIEPADRFEIRRGPSDALSKPTFSEMVRTLRANGCHDGIRLLRAAIKRFTDHWGELGGELGGELKAIARDDPRQQFVISYETDIPRQVGMSGSSAIIIAAMRALMDWFGVKIEPAVLAELALTAETVELGIAAGPMDRVLQAYEGVLYMDFELPRSAESYTRLDPALLPPLFMAYDPRVGEPSGKVHGDVRARWLRGDPDVRQAIAVFPSLVDRGLECLRRGDRAGFLELMNTNFDTRASIWTLGERDHEMVRIGREHGAAVKFSGSGGAVIGATMDESPLGAIEKAYTEAGYRFFRPEIE